MKIETLSADIKEALAMVQRKHGVVISVGAVSYSATEFRCSLKGKVLDRNGTTQSADMTEWNTHCYKFGLFPKHFGVDLVIGGKYIKVIGIRLKARKYPVLAQDIASGKLFCYPAASLVLAYNAKFAEKSKAQAPTERNVTPLMNQIEAPLPSYKEMADEAEAEMSLDSMENALRV